METWTDLCRCCLSTNSEVSLLDSDLDVTQKFLEITTIEVKADDGLPQNLCAECFSILNSAYQFRKQCIKMESELKVQLNNALSQCNDAIDDLETANHTDNNDNDIEFANNPLKQLEAVIKQEPMDSDDDYYYVLVIDNPEDQVNSDQLRSKHVKTEMDIKPEIEEYANTVPAEFHTPETNDQEFDSSMDYLVTNNIPVNVPATILENEEEPEEITETNEIQDNATAVVPYIAGQNEDSQDNIIEEITDNQKLIKILTSTGEDGTILLKAGDEIQYLTEGQLMGNIDGDNENSEVILCEGEDSHIQILKYDGSELVIEYADDSQIATVLQQNEGTFLCGCGEQLSTLEEYEHHQNKHNPGGEHLCNLCGKGFETAEILTGHRLLHNVSGQLLKCPFCDQVMKRSTLTQHIKYSHNNAKPQCTICSKTFANPNNLKRHMMIHSGVKEFECDICLKRFSQKITMQTHKITHVNPLFCAGCETIFKSKDEIDQHKLTNRCKPKKEIVNLGKLLGYGCSICGTVFSIESALERHIELEHMVAKSELLCSECGEVVGSKKDMLAHNQKHDKRKVLKRFECNTCGKACSSQAMLLMHERVHTNERPFACQLCPLKFKTKTHLRTHQLTHTREKKFGCCVCLKFFALKGNLVVHLRTHTGERPYVCSICGDAFIDSKYLKKHKGKKHAIDNVPWNQYLNFEEDNEVV